MKESRSAPPDLRGFEFVRWLGGGGFADVFLFRQRRPNRDVAVKVIRQTVFDARIQEQFEGEADLMAAVSEHPFIVSVYAADIAPDGRPYLAMEYYPKGSYLERARDGSVTVAEALRVGIQIASAVETAHEATIFHNDIKPSNILVSSFDRPGLTDFGISVVASESANATARGASLPYTAPEIVESEVAGSRTSDVFALGATLYALLAGHSPFERKDAPNTAADVLDRVLHHSPPPISRPGVPASLEHLIRQTLSRRADQRPRTARSLAVSLQAIEQELGLQMTPLELRTAAESRPVAPVDDTDSTRYSAPVVVRPHEPSVPPPPQPLAPASTPAERVAAYAPLFEEVAHGRPAEETILRGGGAAAQDATQHRQGPAPSVPAKPEAGLAERRWLRPVAASIVGVIVIGGAVAYALGGDGTDAPSPGGGVGPTSVSTEVLFPPTKVRIAFVGAEVVEASWDPPSGTRPAGYVVSRTDAAARGTTTETTEPTLKITGVPAGVTPCIEVVSRSATSVSQESTGSVCATR